MSEDLEKLRSIGAQKIHEQTHISLHAIQALLHQSFDGMQKVQLLGFISILEREYDVDLASLRQSAIEYFEENEKELDQEASYKKELLVSAKTDKKRVYIIAALVAIIVIALFYLLVYKDGKSEESKASVQAHVLEESPREKNRVTDRSDEMNESVPEKTASAPLKQKRVREDLLSIVPKTKLWLGIIDLDTGRKRQTVTSQPYEINASGNYLLTFGHGYLDIVLDGERRSFKESGNLKFLYREGNLTKIDNAEFRRYNRGKLW